MLGWIVGLLIAVAIFFIVVMVIDGNRFVTREYTLTTDKTENEYTLVMLADLHNKSYGKDNEKLIAAIEKVKPDYVLTAGDILTAKPGKSFETALSFMKKLAVK